MFCKRKHWYVILPLSIFSVACAGGGSTASSDEATITTTPVEVVNIAFKPAALQIEEDTEVVWTNKDEGVRHTATSGVPGEDAVPGVDEGKPPRSNGLFDGDLPGASSTFRFTFEEPGTYKYFCRIHPSMTGQIIVR